MRDIVHYEDAAITTIERLEQALKDIVKRSNTDKIGTAKVIDMRNIALKALED